MRVPRADGGGESDAGSAVPLVVGLIAVAVALALAVSTLAGVAAREARAQALADAAAIAGAVAERQEGDGCAHAAEVVVANGATLLGCEAVDHGDVTVRVQVGEGALSEAAVARAGPAFAP